MKILLIACETLRDEISKVREFTKFRGDIIWMNTSLHNDSEILRSELQKVIDNNIGYEYILLSYGSCGNSTVGLKASFSKLVLPLTSDCISMLLYHEKDINFIRKDTYFLTKGWINGDKSIIIEYQYCVDKYGEKRAQRIFGAMLKHYNHLMLIDTKSYNIEEYEKIASDLASKLNLNYYVQEGSLGILEKMLTGQWDKDFLVLEQGEEILLKYFE